VGPKGCTTRKPVLTKGARARTAHGRKLTERSAELGERTDPRHEPLSVGVGATKRGRRRGTPARRRRKKGRRERKRRRRERELREGGEQGWQRETGWPTERETETGLGRARGDRWGISCSFILRRPRELRGTGSDVRNARSNAVRLANLSPCLRAPRGGGFRW